MRLVSGFVCKTVYILSADSQTIICFVVKIFIFLRFSLYIFESDTVITDCPVQIFRKMKKYLKI